MTEFPRVITREAVNDLAIRRYAGEVCLVATREDVARAAADFATERVVGFDTETRPAFRVGQRYPTALVQVATARAVYVFQLARMDFSAVLAPLLSSGSTVKAGRRPGEGLRPPPPPFQFTPAAIVRPCAPARPQGLAKTVV